MICPEDHPLGVPPEPRPSWTRFVEACDPASLLLVIERRLSLRAIRLDPDDVLQEALFRSWRAWDRATWHGYRASRSWLLTIIDNCIADAADHARADKRGGGTPIYSFDRIDSKRAPGEWADSSTPSRRATRREHAVVIRDALDGVPVDLREVVFLRIFEQRALDDIAASLGLSEPQVRRRVRVGCEAFQAEVRRRLGHRSTGSSISNSGGPGA